MMLAAAAAGQRKGDPDPLLKLALRCERWEALPLPGGMLDQPDWLMDQFAVSLNVFHAWRSYTDKGWKVDDIRWAERNPSAWKVIGATEKLKRFMSDLEAEIEKVTDD